MAGPVIAIHAGAGSWQGTAAQYQQPSADALRQALDSARAVLEGGSGHAIDAVQAAIMDMEAFELFNAGRGAVLCADGSVELSAALMRSDRAAGAVAAIKTTKYPIIGARVVLKSRQVLMIGEAADALAARRGAEQVAPSYFITERQQARLREVTDPTRDGADHAEDGAEPTTDGADHATVGAVCLDRHGVLVAGTSTGGIRAQTPGRVGDCPVIGAGTWADRRVAVSCTGDGEAFIRSGTARYVGALLERAVA